MSPEKKKRQHYVPRLILRRFSKDGLRISLLVLESGKRIDGAGIREQCYEDYFYGEDGKVENAFAALEGEFSTAMSDCTLEHLDNLSEEQTFLVQYFVHIQRSRTLGAASQMDEWSDSFAKQVLARDPRIAAHGIDLDKVRIGLQKPQDEALYHCITTWPLILDLRVAFLVAERRLGFIVSDHPVVLYNQWAEHHALFRGYQGTTGLAAKGLQVFMPISPRVCIALFDAGTYQYGSPKHRVCSIGLRDVRLVNFLQAINAHECVYFDPDLTPPDELAALREVNRKNLGWQESQFYESEIVRRSDGTSSQLIGFSMPGIRLGAKFGFLKVTDTTSYDGYRKVILPMRSEELVQLTNEYAEGLRKRVKEQRAAAGEREGDLGEDEDP